MPLDSKQLRTLTTGQRFFRSYLLKKQNELQQAIDTSPNKLLLQAIHVRFQCMRAVAAAKFPTKKPIEDKEQEARVLDSVKKLATEKGIVDLTTIERFFQQNIILSKTIQRPYYERIWTKAPRDNAQLINNAYIQLRNLVAAAGYADIQCCLDDRSFLPTEVLFLARDIIQHVNQIIIDVLADKNRHKLDETSQEELVLLINKMLANYMTPDELSNSCDTIESFAHELKRFP